MPLPTRFADEQVSLPPCDSEFEEDEFASVADIFDTSVKYTRRPEQRVVLKRIRGQPSNKAVIGAAIELATRAERDGLRVRKQEGRPVLLHLCYDAKIGFNSRAKISMSNWISMPRFLQDNQVAVFLDER